MIVCHDYVSTLKGCRRGGGLAKDRRVTLGPNLSHHLFGKVCVPFLWYGGAAAAAATG